MSEIYEDLKASVDKYCVDLAAELGVSYVSLTDTVNVAQSLETNTLVLLSEIVGVPENPRHPLYSAEVHIGCKVGSDTGALESSTISEIKEHFKVSTRWQIKNYGETVADEVSGSAYITACEVLPAGGEGNLVMRMVAVRMAVQADA